MSTTPSTREPRDFRTYFRVLFRHKLLVAVVTIIVIVLALAAAFVQSKTYTASADVLLSSQSATSALQPSETQIQPTSDYLARVLADAQQFANGNQTKNAAQQALHRKASATASVSATADILTFTASAGDSHQAAQAANTYARSFITQYVGNQVSQYTGQVTDLQQSIATLQSRVNDPTTGSQEKAAATASISSLTQALQQLQAASQLVRSSAPTLVKAATVPSAPSSPKKPLYGALGLFAGLFLGIALAFTRDRLDDKIESLQDVEDYTSGTPVVGTIPLVDSWRKDAGHHVALLENSDSAAAEAYRTLRTAIQFIGLDERQRVIGVTSSTANEGKSTATANLAISFASAGQRVIAVSCDFRRPRLHQFFGEENSVGATSVLLGQSSLQEALRDVPGQPNLRILTSGPVPPNPAEILSLDRVKHLVDSLAANADLVILDCPPVLPVTDTLLISRLCDAVYVLTVAGGTKKNDLRRTYTLLEQVGAPTRGTVINRVADSRMAPANYGYGYGYGYTSEPEPGQPKTAWPKRIREAEESVTEIAASERTQVGVGAGGANGNGRRGRRGRRSDGD